jgi:HlyD family secretion protein
MSLLSPFRALVTGVVRKTGAFVKAHKVVSVIMALGVLILGMGISWIFTPAAPEYVLAEVEPGDIQQTVEAVGTVVSEKDLTLKFPVTGVVAEVFVTEGQTVTAGQQLARLKNEAVAADVNGAQARVSAELARLNELKQGTRPEDIMIAEAELANKRAALDSAQTTLKNAEIKVANATKKLEQLRKEAGTSLAGTVATAQSTSSKQLTAANTAIKSLDDLLARESMRRVVEQFESSAMSVLLNQQESAEDALTAGRSLTITSFDTYEEGLVAMDQIRGAILAASNVLNDAYDLVARLPLAGNLFDTAEREEIKEEIATHITTAATALDAITTVHTDLKNASASYTTKILAEEDSLATAENTRESALSDILTYETAVRTSEAALARDKAGARKTEIDAAQAAVNQAAAELKRARAHLDDTILRAPYDGVITTVGMKVGEFTGDLESFDRPISMLGSSPYRVEMFIAEIDIPKVVLTQSGSVELDAFPRVSFPLRVSEIDPVATDVDGVSKYLVKLDFVTPPENLRIGMSGDAEIYTDLREDVLIIPGRAVFRTDEGEFVRVLLEDGTLEEKQVVTGLDGADGEVEVLSGLEGSEQIVVLIRE